VAWAWWQAAAAWGGRGRTAERHGEFAAKAICHRKNSLFYKTLNGARVGDIYMSLIHTAELNAMSPFEYLVALQRYHDKVADCPADWMPWNYREALAKLTKGPDPPT
jgi:hypothetical protein